MVVDGLQFYPDRLIQLSGYILLSQGLLINNNINIKLSKELQGKLMAF